jgi:heat shock protein HtpX
MLAAVASRAGMRPPGLHLLDVPEPISLAAVGRKGYIILSRGLLETLDGEELEAVLAHEAMHLKNDDSRFKVFASTLSAILFFDPLTRLVDAAAHREREYLADEAASRVTGRPASLAAALLKLSTSAGTTTGRIGALSVLGSYGRLLSRHPPLGERLSRLLALAEALKPPGGVP